MDVVGPPHVRLAPIPAVQPTWRTAPKRTFRVSNQVEKRPTASEQVDAEVIQQGSIAGQLEFSVAFAGIA